MDAEDDQEITVDAAGNPDLIPPLDADGGEHTGYEFSEEDGALVQAGAFDSATEGQRGSAEDNDSIPDDTPSVQGSPRSSPRSESLAIHSPAPRKSPSGIHRPFDRRFQSRLSSYSVSSPRASSPAFLNAHSRQSSSASVIFQASTEPDDSSAPWDVIRWHRLRKITNQAFSEVAMRNFGRPTCLAVTDNIVIGTSKGLVLVFDHMESPKAIIGSGTKATESGGVTSLAISADHTTVASGHVSGHIFTWEIARPARPFLHIPPIETFQPQARRADGHVTGCTVLHIGFLGYRHTALVSADDRGMAFSHLATRGMGAVARTVRSTRVLGRYPDVVNRTAKPSRQSSVLAFAPLPLGNVEQDTDPLGLVAIMTPYLLVIVSTTPVAQTQHKSARPKEVAAHGALSAALAWFPAIKLKAKGSEVSRTKLVYCWSNVLTVLEVRESQPQEPADTEKPPDLLFVARSRFKCEEAIVGVQWLSRSVLAVLTITQQLLILEDVTMHVTDSFDLLQKNIYHADLYSQQLQSLVDQLDDEDTLLHGVVADAFHMSFRAYKGRLYLLGANDTVWGSLTNWADRLLAMMEIGDYIGAIKLATTYYAGVGEKVTIGLPEDGAARSIMVREKLLEMISASLKYAFGRNQQAGSLQVEKAQLAELVAACIASCITTDDQDFLFDEVFPWFDDHGQARLFLDILEPYIFEGEVVALPPTAVKALFDNFTITRSPTKLEELICLLDTSTMDIDQVTSLCKRHSLYDAYIYVWNKALRDYTSPIEELLRMVPSSQNSNVNTDTSAQDHANAQKVFPYLSFVLTGRTYPTGIPMSDADSMEAKTQVYDFLFSGLSNVRQGVSNTALVSGASDTSFVHLRQILNYDAASFMSVLNEAFEDTYLNNSAGKLANGSADGSDGTGAARSDSINRQLIVRIMLEVMSSHGHDREDRAFLDMFIARNLPKYPQYILLSGTALHDILMRLCDLPTDDMRDDAELSVEYLMSVYKPPDALSLVPVLKQVKFFRVLKTIFKQEQQYANYIATFFVDEDNQTDVFPAIASCLRAHSDLSTRQRRDVLDVLRAHARKLAEIDVGRAAIVIDQVAPQLHETLLHAQQRDPHLQYEYLQSLLGSDDSYSAKADKNLIELYVRLMCQYDPSHVAGYVDGLKAGDLRLEEVLPAMEASGAVDAAVMLLTRQGRVKDAMDRLVKHLNSCAAVLTGLLQSSQQSPDLTMTDEAIADMLESLDKYTGVGIWLCQGQTKSSHKSRSATKSPGRSAASKHQLSFEEQLWLDLLSAVVSIGREVSSRTTRSSVGDDYTTSSLRQIIQRLFTALLNATTTARDGSGDKSDFSFLRILRGFLTYAASSSPSLAELRSVLGSIFSAYAYEESLLALTNSMLDRDLFVQVDDVAKRRQQGWRPRGQVCEVCRRRVWGPGVGGQIWEAWWHKERSRVGRRLLTRGDGQNDGDDMSRGKGKAAEDLPHGFVEDDSSDAAAPKNEELGPIVIFSCRHVYHQTCVGKSHMREDGSGQAVPLHVQVELQCPACA